MTCILEIKASITADLDALTECQIAAFPDSLSSLLGKRFCAKMLEWYIVAERGVLFHVVDDGHVAGYCSGVVTKFQGQHGASTSIVQYAFVEFALAFVRRPWLLLHPEMLKKRQLIARNLRMKFKVESPDLLKQEFRPAPKATTYWGLVGIGVTPQYRGKGLGTLLLNEFERKAREDGVDEVHLSVKQQNAGAIKLYERNGWRVSSRSSDSFEMSKSLST